MWIDFISSTNTVNALNWYPLISTWETGGSPILNYKLRWNQGASINTWTDLTSVSSPTTQYIHTTLSPGVYYDYTVSAQNIHGFGPSSAIFSTITSQPPNAPDAVVTTVYLTFIKVTWAAPFSNY